MSCDNLPQELIEAIADNIWHDKRALSAFSLVCKAWTNPARDHLFNCLVIFNLEDLEKIKATNMTSTYTPFLRDLRLVPQHFHEIFWHEVIPFLADFGAPRLRSLELRGLTWQSLSLDERSALLRPFELIVSLRLSPYRQDPDTSNFNGIATIICSFPHLRELFLEPCQFNCTLSGSAPLSPELRLPERLSTIDVVYYSRDCRLILEWLSSIPEQLSIRTFCLSMYWDYPQDLDVVNKFLRALGPSLEVFRFRCGRYCSFDLAYNTDLRCVKFYVKLETSHFFSTDVSFVISILSRIQSRQLEQVAFELSGFSQGVRDRDIPKTEWIKMDTMLAGPQFATLKNIHLSSLLPDSDVILSLLCATLLPRCHACGIISILGPSL